MISKLYIIAILYLPLAILASVTESAGQDIFCMGNGKLAVYGAGADIIQVFGPPYSAPPTSFEMKLDSSINVVSVREKGTAIWRHELKRRDHLVARITDFVDKDRPFFIRRITAYDDFSFRIRFPGKIERIPNSDIFKGEVSQALLLKTPAGSYIYNSYPQPVESYHQLLLKGEVTLHEGIIEIKKGESTILVSGGPSYPECIRNMRDLLDQPDSVLLERTRKYWKYFTNRRINFNKTVPKNLPQRDKLLQTIDDVAILIKTQMSVEGAVLAGYNYHLGYVRDQYGVSRGLLKLGYIKEAREILNFYWKIWKEKGKIHNAQGIGVDAFHIHENDEVEITGYLIMQAFDYLRKTNDQVFLKEIFPMLEWAWNSQVKNLHKEMLPFNGDETYVAGGILPRSALLDGSAEATLLFITGGKQFLQWIEKNKKWDIDRISKNRSVLKRVEDRFRENFFTGSVFYANNPDRRIGLTAPAFRHGVCEALLEGCDFFSWTQRNDYNRYACPKCFPKAHLQAAESKKYRIQSTALIPLYIGSGIFSKEEISKMVGDIMEAYQKTGNLPSRPEGGLTVGYDYGLLLYNLSVLNRSEKADIYKKMISVLDRSGAWVEYYKDGKPAGTRYRPWESSINLEAALEFAEKY